MALLVVVRLTFSIRFYITSIYTLYHLKIKNNDVLFCIHTDVVPPVFVNCSTVQTLTFVAPKKSTSAKVIWDDPVAIDNVDTNVNVTKLTDLKKGSFVEHDEITYVEYQAFDTAGNPSSLCTISLEVKGKLVDIRTFMSCLVVLFNADNQLDIIKCNLQVMPILTSSFNKFQIELIICLCL